MWCAVAVFAATNLALAASSGVRSGGDTGIYTSGASALLSGEPLTARQPSYAGYIAVVAASEALGFGLPGVVAFQIAAAAAAAAIVFVLAAALGGLPAAFLAVMLLTMDLETNRWHAFILSDSLFASSLVAVTWLVYRTPPTASTAGYLPPIAMLLIAATIRPEGWLVIPAAIAFWIARAAIRPTARVAWFAALTMGCAGLGAAVAPQLSGNVDAVGPVEMLKQGQTIWGYDGWRVNMAADQDDGQDSAAAAIGYAVRHPVDTATLMAARVAVHFAHVRPFFSTAHNVMIVAWLTPIYALAGYGAITARRDVITWWCAMVLATQTLVVALTHADWDGRYLAHVMPVIYPFTACGAAALAMRWRRGPIERTAIA